MNILQKTALIALLTTSFFSLAGEKVDKSLPASDISRVNIENLRGEVSINGWDKAEVSITGELDDESEGLVFQNRDGSIFIKVKMPRRLDNNWQVKKSSLVINMPKNVRVTFSGVSSDVKITGLNRGAEIQSVSGSIVAKNISEFIDFNTVSGDIKSDSLSGKIRLSSVSGDITDNTSTGRLTLKVVSGEISAHSQASEVSVNNVSGDIELKLKQVDELVISTVSGEVESELSLNKNAEVRLSSVSGDFEMNFIGLINASFSIDSNAGGDIVNKLSSDRVKHDKYGPSSRLYFQMGDGSASVKANTVSGEIKLVAK
jgi:DUF4097 and DUF4098 domain-containing protein YvlB